MIHNANNLKYIAFKNIINTESGEDIINKFSKYSISIYLDMKNIRIYLNERNCSNEIINMINDNNCYEWLSNHLYNKMDISDILLYNIINIVTNKFSLHFTHEDIFQMIINHDESDIYSSLSSIYKRESIISPNFEDSIYEGVLPSNEKYSHIYFSINVWEEIGNRASTYQINLDLIKPYPPGMLNYMTPKTKIYQNNVDSIEQDILNILPDMKNIIPIGQESINLSFDDNYDYEYNPPEIRVTCLMRLDYNNNTRLFILDLFKNIIINYCPSFV
jgi:hypothetical protein